MPQNPKSWPHKCVTCYFKRKTCKKKKKTLSKIISDDVGSVGKYRIIWNDSTTNLFQKIKEYEGSADGLIWTR